MIVDIKKVQITVTVPFSHVDIVRNAIWGIGAGIIGEYTNCSLASKVIGTFKPSLSAKPFIGENNELEFVEEEQLEFRCNVEEVKKVVQKIREVHPYEEPAINIIPLMEEDSFN